MKRIAACLLLVVPLLAGHAFAAVPTPEHWTPVARLIGGWYTYRHVETPVNSPTALVFESESFENFNNTWKAPESYEFLSSDEFVETFELAPPGQPFRTYSRTQLKRVAR